VVISVKLLYIFIINQVDTPSSYARLVHLSVILPWLGLSHLLLGRHCQAWHQESLRPMHQLLLCPPGYHMLATIVLALILPCSLCFHLPDLKVDSNIEADSHSEIHDSLVNSTLKSFNFHLNLSSVAFATSVFIIILIILISRKQNLAIARVSAQILKQKKSLEVLMKWKVEATTN
jgi:hypothetical protein